MLGGDLEHGDDLALLHALAHQALVAARAERQREGVEENRLAGAGLAGEHGQALGKIDVEPVDQHDVTDRKSGKHVWPSPSRRHARLYAGHPRPTDSPPSLRT